MNKEHEEFATAIVYGIFGLRYASQVEMGMRSNLVDGVVEVGEEVPTAFGVMRDAMRERQVLFEFYSGVAKTDELLVAIHKLNEAVRRWSKRPVGARPTRIPTLLVFSTGRSRDTLKWVGVTGHGPVPHIYHYVAAAGSVLWFIDVSQVSGPGTGLLQLFAHKRLVNETNRVEVLRRDTEIAHSERERIMESIMEHATQAQDSILRNKTSRELVELGIEQGIERGIERGIEQGIEQGIESGRRAALLEMAAHLYGQLVADKLGEIEDLGELARELERRLTQAH